MVRRKTGPSGAQVEAVFARSGGLCEICGGEGQQLHHRLARGAGGTRNPNINNPENLAHLCMHCHLVRVETDRSVAYGNGWLVHSWDDPAVVPFLKHGVEVILD